MLKLTISSRFYYESEVTIINNGPKAFIDCKYISIVVYLTRKSFEDTLQR